MRRQAISRLSVIALLAAFEFSIALAQQPPASGPPAGFPSGPPPGAFPGGPPPGGGPAGGPPGAADPNSGFAALTRVFRGAPDRPPSTDPRDFEGTWLGGSPALGSQPPYTPEARAIAERHMRMSMTAQPVANTHITCRPNGPGYFVSGGTVVAVQTPQQLTFMYGADEREVLQIFIGGKHPQKVKPSYNGHAIGRWEGNTLVVDMVGFNGLANLGMAGPSSDRMHVVLRMTKTADGRALEIKGTVDDPAYLTQPYELSGRWNWDPTVRPFEFDCANGAEADYGAEGLVFENELFRPVCVRDHDTDVVSCEKPEAKKAK